MKDKKVGIILGVMCLALTVGICVQVKTIEKTNSTISSSATVNTLRDQVLRIKEKYENLLEELDVLEEKLEIARTEATQDNAELTSLQEKIVKANKLLGLTEVKGPGVKIKLQDANVTNGLALSTDNLSALILHDIDVRCVINELKSAGAEAISINGQRIVETSAIICVGNVIEVNGQKIGTPFEILAIGLPEQLANLERPGGYLHTLKGYGIQTSLEKTNNITIPKYSGTLAYEYAVDIK